MPSDHIFQKMTENDM